MGQRAVAITTDLVTMFITQGSEFGGPYNTIRCTEGLLPGAVLEHSFIRWLENGIGGRGVLYLVYSHPDWEGPENGDPVPDLKVTFQNERLPKEGEPCIGG